MAAVGVRSTIPGPRIHGPKPIMGSRVTLRPFVPGDAAEIARLLENFEVVRYAGEIPWPYGLDQATEFIGLTHRHFAFGRDSIFAAIRERDHALLGCIALHAPEPGEGSRLGYWFGQPYWGQGYATEAISLVLKFGFGVRALSRIEADVHESNIGSWRALEKAGLRFEETIELTFKNRGFVAKARRYGLSRQEWLGRL